MTKFLALLALCSACSAAPAEMPATSNPDTIYSADLLPELDSALAEWASFGLVAHSTSTRPETEFFSEVRLVDRVCEIWPDAPANAIGCAYSVRPGPVLDSAATARSAGDALAWIIEVKRGSNTRREILHELGHVFGFCHTGGPTLMNAVENSAVTLTAEDLANPC